MGEVHAGPNGYEEEFRTAARIQPPILVSLWDYVERNGKGHGPHTTRDVLAWRIGGVDRADWVEDRMRWLESFAWARAVEPEGRQRKARWQLRPDHPRA